MAGQRPSQGGDPFGIRERFLSVCAAMGRDELARALGIPAERLNAILRGDEEVSAESVTRLCQRTGLSPLWMLSGQGPKRADELRGYLGGRPSSE